MIRRLAHVLKQPGGHVQLANRHQYVVPVPGDHIEAAVGCDARSILCVRHPIERLVLSGKNREVPLARAPRESFEVDQSDCAGPVSKKIPNMRVGMDDTLWQNEG